VPLLRRAAFDRTAARRTGLPAGGLSCNTNHSHDRGDDSIDELSQPESIRKSAGSLRRRTGRRGAAAAILVGFAGVLMSSFPSELAHAELSPTPEEEFGPRDIVMTLRSAFPPLCWLHVNPALQQA
jgi:hypothetical protein